MGREIVKQTTCCECNRAQGDCHLNLLYVGEIIAVVRYEPTESIKIKSNQGQVWHFKNKYDIKKIGVNELEYTLKHLVSILTVHIFHQ